jgi:hypothetical protein
VLEPGPVVGDGVLLEQLIGNLIDNAEQYNVPGGSIAISTGTTDGAAVLRVVNTGPVIPPGSWTGCFCRSRGWTIASVTSDVPNPSAPTEGAPGRSQ